MIPRVLITKDDSTPIDQSDNNIGYLALHYLFSEFMALPLKHRGELLGSAYTPTSLEYVCVRLKNVPKKQRHQ